ncbi:hypothetical protein HZH68_003814 [Vespula germanica]|uniref:Uncharacterized protein n=1 Tax=Vespula germanica TaxID=30212 RepID=A0A834KMI4_VESGE|nr:hypothetical protein HZH68_003814 [Vespula germanica]
MNACNYGGGGVEREGWTSDRWWERDRDIESEGRLGEEGDGGRRDRTGWSVGRSVHPCWSSAVVAAAAAAAHYPSYHNGD